MPTFPVTYSEAHVELAALDTLRTWYHDFLADTERRHGVPVDRIQRPRSYQVRSSFEDVQERQFPCVAVSSPGVQDEEWTGDGRLDGWVQILVGVAVDASTPEQAQRLAKLHLHAVRQLIIGRPSLGGALPITGFSVEDAGGFDDAAFEIAGRKVTRASGVIACLFLLEGLAYKGAGPTTPTRPPVTRPPADPVTADTVEISITTDP